MIDGDAYLPVTTNPAYVTATMPDDDSSTFPTALIIDEDAGTNWDSSTASFVSGLANDCSDMQITLADGETTVPFGVEKISQVPGRRALVVHIGIRPLCASVGTELLLWRGGGGGPYEDKAGVYPASDGWWLSLPMNDTGVSVANWADRGYEFEKDDVDAVIPTDGVVDGGQLFDDGAVYCGDFRILDQCTTLQWVYPYATNVDMTVYAHHYYSYALGIRSGNWAYNNVWGLWIPGHSAVANTWSLVGLSLNKPDLIVYSWDPTNGWRQSYREHDRAIGTHTSIGEAAWGAGNWQGIIDGARAREPGQSNDWLLTTAQLEYYNDAFWTIGEEVLLATRSPNARRRMSYRLGPSLFMGGIL